MRPERSPIFLISCESNSSLLIRTARRTFDPIYSRLFRRSPPPGGGPRSEAPLLVKSRDG
eukprot:scaffold26098_cov32-Tisochrysis_lutea.AAC.1